MTAQSTVKPARPGQKHSFMELIFSSIVTSAASPGAGYGAGQSLCIYGQRCSYANPASVTHSGTTFSFMGQELTMCLEEASAAGFDFLSQSSSSVEVLSGQGKPTFSHLTTTVILRKTL